MGQMWELKRVNYAKHLTVPGLGSLFSEYWRAEHIPVGVCTGDVSASSRNLGPQSCASLWGRAGREWPLQTWPCKDGQISERGQTGGSLSPSPQAAVCPYVDTELVWFSEEAWLISPRGFFTFRIQTNCCFLINRAPTTLLSVFSWIYFLLNPFSFSHPVYFQAVIFHAAPQGVGQRRKRRNEEDKGAGVVLRWRWLVSADSSHLTLCLQL